MHNKTYCVRTHCSFSKKVLIFNQLQLKIDSDFPPISRPHWKEESQGFPTVYGMLMENFFSKNPLIGKLCKSTLISGCSMDVWQKISFFWRIKKPKGKQLAILGSKVRDNKERKYVIYLMVKQEQILLRLKCSNDILLDEIIGRKFGKCKTPQNITQ